MSAGPDPHAASGAPTAAEPADPPAAPPPPRWLRPLLDYPTIERLGRSWPAAGRFERTFWGLLLVAVLTVLGIARALDPDPRGIGTHEQLGLPPCGFVQVFEGVPCPSCGYTTTFALAADFEVGAAIANQPFGFLVFLLSLAAIPAAALGVSGVSLFACTERWPMVRLFAGLVGLWLLAWGYKYLALTQL